MSCRLVDFPVKTSGESFPLTVLKFFLRFIRHFETSVVRTILLEMADAAQKKTSRRRSVEMSGM